MQSIPRLETERLHLRAIRPTDSDAVFRIYSDPNVTSYSELATFSDPSQAAELIANFTWWFQNDVGVRWGLFLKSSDELIGVCCFDTYLVKYHATNIGYDLASEYWNQGYTTEAVAVVVEHAFAHGLVSPIHRIQALVHGDNPASDRVLEKCGFQHEGTMRQYGYWDGQYHDMNLFSRLADVPSPPE